MLPTKAGRLRHRIQINQPTPAAASQWGNSPSTTWTPLGDGFWASVEPVSGRDLEIAKTFSPTVSHKITMRYVRGILPTYQLVYAGRIFKINAALDTEERKRTLVMFCTEQIKT